jgi:3-dehydroquinate synthase class II
LDSDSLNERQKQKLVEAISNAESVEEAKVIFETLQNTVGSTFNKSQPNSLSEAIQKSSSVILSARKNNPERQKSNPTLNRWKFLAGIDK